jgi:hypothetical protein
MKEIFKTIPDYPSYQVSNWGNVKSFKWGKERILKPGLYNNGYFLNHKPDGHKLVVDHIDNDKSNNRRENLQIITSRENSSKDKKGYTSKYVGVCWNTQINKWQSRIMINGKVKYLGSFDRETEASKTYEHELKKIYKNVQNPNS